MSPGTRRREWTAWALAAIAVLAVAILAVPASRDLRTAAPESVPVRFDIATPPTDNSGSFAVSPDGRQLVYVANVDDGFSRLWIRSLDQTAARSLTGTENASFPFWSPDSRAVGFFADGKLKRIDVATGTSQVLADAPSGRGGTWSTDGVIIFTPASNGGLSRVASTGGQAVPVLQFAGAPRWPQFLPDGRHFLFFVLLAGPEIQGTYIASLDGDKPVRVLPGDSAAVYAPPDYLFAVRQNVLVVFHFDPAAGMITGDPMRVTDAVGSDTGLGRSGVSVSSNGVLLHRGGTAAQPRQFVWVDRAGHMLGTVGARDDTTSPGIPELAPDGRRIAFIRTVQGNNDVWMMDVTRGVESRFTFNPASENYEVWSPDGKRIAFASTRNGGYYDLFEKSATGGDDEQSLLATSQDTSQDKRPLAWSPDGRFLLYVNLDLKTGADLWALPMTGDRKPFPVVQTNFSESEGQFSPDGRWLAYVSNESGRFETYVRPFPGTGQRVQVSTVGGSQVRWRRDGRELYYVTPDSRLMAVAINVKADGSTLDVGAPVALFTTVLATGAQATGLRAQYAVGADGHFLMNNRISDATPAPITVVLNWAAGLGK